MIDSVFCFFAGSKASPESTGLKSALCLVMPFTFFKVKTLPAEVNLGPGFYFFNFS
jgi:hypothetical protein